MSEEDETHATSMLGGVEETSSLDLKVLGVRWNPMKDVFTFDLTEIANYARNLQPTKRNVVVLLRSSMIPLDSLHQSSLSSSCSSRIFAKRKLVGMTPGMAIC